MLLAIANSSCLAVPDSPLPPSTGCLPLSFVQRTVWLSVWLGRLISSCPNPTNMRRLIIYVYIILTMAILKGVLEDINLPCLSSRLLAPGSAGWLPLNWLTSSTLCHATSLAVCLAGCLQKGDKPRSCLSDSLTCSTAPAMRTEALPAWLSGETGASALASLPGSLARPLAAYAAVCLPRGCRTCP